MNCIFSFISIFLLIFTKVQADNYLYSNSLVNCMKNNTDIIPNFFSVVFNGDDGSLTYDISLTANIQGKLKVYATVYAFGFDIVHETIDLCSLNLKQFCPITPSEMEVESTEHISQDYIDRIPGIAYHFPDLDAIARLIITNDDNEILGCLQASFNNGKTVSHEGAKWATACVAGLGLLISGLLSVFGNSASASRMSAAALSLFTYFQSVVIIAMISVDEVPPIANSWAENLTWSMGLIRIHFMQQIFRWFVQATGGIPTQYLTTGVYSILTQRSIQRLIKTSFAQHVISFFTHDEQLVSNELIARSSDTDSEFIPLNKVESNDYLHVLRGIKRIGYNANIEPTSIVCTGFTFFILCLYVLVGVFFIYRYLTKALTKGQRNNWISKKLENRSSWQPTFKGILSRYIFIGFPQLLILSLWEFTVNDSGAVVTVAVFFLILVLSSMAYCCFQVVRFARKSIEEHGNPAAILYGNPDVLNRYGFLYTMLNARKYWFCCVSLAYLFVKSLFVGLSQGSGRTQTMALWILDMFYLGLMCHFLPYLDKFTNILFVFLQVIITINSFLFTFFSGIYGQPLRVASVMGLVFFIMNAVVSLLLLIIILVLAIFTMFSKNPDARFSPTKDDRTSFQRKHQSLNVDNMESNELFELGRVAKEHDENWEDEMYHLRDVDNNDVSTPDLDGKYADSNTLSKDVDDSENSNKKGLSSFVGKLRNNSILRKKSNRIALDKSDQLLGSKQDLHEKNIEPLNNDSIELLSSSNEFESSDNNINPLSNDNTGADHDPFSSVRNSNVENPFESMPVEMPINHIRNDSRLSGITNNTNAGLSVYGELIDPNDYNNFVGTTDNNSVSNSKLAKPASTRRPSTVADSESGNTQYYDDIHSETSDVPHRRL